MATLRIQFPERDKPSVIELRGRRITVGRTPNNTIQILDRTLSGRHAELFEEDGHYRVRDAGSSNGVFVNGALISDFHLHEACKLTFGSVECDYDPAGFAEDDSAETLPTQADLATLREQNGELGQKLAILQDELSSLRLLQPADGSDAGLVVPQAEHEKVATELAALKEESLKTQQTVAQLHEELAVTQRDNENLQRALDVLKTALDKASPFNASAAAVPMASATFAPAAVKPAAPISAAPLASMPKPAAPGLPKPAAPMAPTPGMQSPPPGLIKPTPVATSPGAPKANIPARPAAPGIPTARPPGSPAMPAGARPPTPGVPSAPKAGPPGMISSSAPKPPGAIPTAKPPGAAPTASSPKPVLKPVAPNVGPPGMISKATEDGTKTQRIDA